MRTDAWSGMRSGREVRRLNTVSVEVSAMLSRRALSPLIYFIGSKASSASGKQSTGVP